MREEIADLHRRMAPYDRAHWYLLSSTYVSIGLELWRADRRPEAVRALERAVEADRHLAAAEADRHLAASDPGRYRNHLIDRLSYAGGPSEGGRPARRGARQPT
ncbi:hypothetical protein ACIP6X_28165 [Streptomyces coeruleorubidus]|uniref:hypothetical protein n=1 Tax=Streptomyces coeruleorubidus TaxID=116188 RepID=UPI00381B9504